MDMRAISPNVAGPDGIQHAGWLKIALTLAVVVVAVATAYHFTGPRQYLGLVEWHAAGSAWQLRLGAQGPLVDFDEAGNDITVDGAEAALPATPTPYLTDARARISWTPYVTKRNGASGTVRAIDIQP
jgi:hypothetical protein